MLQIKAYWTIDMYINWFTAGYRFQIAIYPLRPEQPLEAVRSDLITSLQSNLDNQGWYWMLGELCACLDVIEGEELSAESWHSCL